MDGDWKWRKYNVMICQWITEQFQEFLGGKMRTKAIDFSKCQEKLEKDHELSRKQRRNDDEKVCILRRIRSLE